MKKTALLIIAVLAGFHSIAQDSRQDDDRQHIIDSLKTVIKTAKHDTTKINALFLCIFLNNNSSNNTLQKSNFYE